MHIYSVVNFLYCIETRTLVKSLSYGSMFSEISEISELLGPKMMKTVIMVTSGVLVSEIMWQLYKVYRQCQRKTINVANGCAKQLCKNAEAKIFEVMFFSKDSTLCRSHLGHMMPCAKLNCPVRHLR